MREPETDLLSRTAGSLGAAERGYPVLRRRAHRRGRSQTASLSRGWPCLPLDDGGPPSTEALLSSMHDQVAEADLNGAGAPSFVLAPGDSGLHD